MFGLSWRENIKNCLEDNLPVSKIQTFHIGEMEYDSIRFQYGDNMRVSIVVHENKVNIRLISHKKKEKYEKNRI